MRNLTRPWFNEFGHLIRRLPAACIEECGGTGRRDAPVRHWRERLHFDVPRALAVEYLAASGGRERAELAECDAETLAVRCLWCMCVDARESRRAGDATFQPFGVCL